MSDYELWYGQARICLASIISFVNNLDKLDFDPTNIEDISNTPDIVKARIHDLLTVSEFISYYCKRELLLRGYKQEDLKSSLYAINICSDERAITRSERYLLYGWVSMRNTYVHELHKRNFYLKFVLKRMIDQSSGINSFFNRIRNSQSHTPTSMKSMNSFE